MYYEYNMTIYSNICPLMQCFDGQVIKMISWKESCHSYVSCTSTCLDYNLEWLSEGYVLTQAIYLLFIGLNEVFFNFPYNTNK